MESITPDLSPEDKCNFNGDCSPPPRNSIHELNYHRNIDDISTPSELKFDEDEDEIEDPEITEKKKLIEKCLQDPNTTLEQWKYLAKSKGGLILDEYRRKIWHQLVGVTKDEMTEPPSLDELSTHSEYNQVVLDVNRSLKRFPPGIPYEQRVALQDQLTVLILRVIIKYPHLKYYQAIELAPEEKAAYVARSKCYLLLGEPRSALADAEAALQLDPKHVQALLHKAEALYYCGEFELSLVHYHRGLRTRPDLHAFRLGVQKAQEAIENTIGTVKPTKKTSKKTPKATRPVLGQLMSDKIYLENLLKNPDLAIADKKNDEVTRQAEEALRFLENREEFWRQQQTAAGN